MYSGSERNGRESLKTDTTDSASRCSRNGRRSAQLSRTAPPSTTVPSSVDRRSHSADILQHGRPVHGVTCIDGWRTTMSSMRRHGNGKILFGRTEDNEGVHALSFSVEIELKMDWQGCKQV